MDNCERLLEMVNIDEHTEQDKGKQQAAASPLRAFWTKQLGGERPAFELLQPIFFGRLVHVHGAHAVLDAVSLASAPPPPPPQAAAAAAAAASASASASAAANGVMIVCVCDGRGGRVQGKGQRRERVFDMCYGQPRDMWPPPALCVCVCVCGRQLSASRVRSHTHKRDGGGVASLACHRVTYLNRIL